MVQSSLRLMVPSAAATPLASPAEAQRGSVLAPSPPEHNQKIFGAILCLAPIDIVFEAGLQSRLEYGEFSPTPSRGQIEGQSDG